MKMLEDIINQIHEVDCIAFMKSMPMDSVDLIFADPPYNLQLQNDLVRPDGSSVDAVRDKWDRFDKGIEYSDFTWLWMEQAQRILKPTGSFWVIGSYHNIFTVGSMMQKIGFWFLNDVIWEKNNPMPNFLGTRFTNAHETLIWAKKNQDAKNVTFHYQDMKAENGGKQMRSVWKMPICQGKERLKDDDGNKLHSTQKPLALLERIVLASSNVGDVLYEPFGGTCTASFAAKKFGRSYIATENEARYIPYARRRLDSLDKG